MVLSGNIVLTNIYSNSKVVQIQIQIESAMHDFLHPRLVFTLDALIIQISYHHTPTVESVSLPPELKTRYLLFVDQMRKNCIKHMDQTNQTM